jgi:glyoxylase-like metal-dependent hydrolase (beta-lactamase superfamily II)
MQIKVLEFSRFQASGHAMFGSTQSLEWQRIYPPVEANLCLWALRSLLIINGADCILIDTGFGSFDKRVLGEYHVEKFKPAYLILAEQGISPEKVTHIIHTHLHLDHCGGSFKEDDNEILIPAFPNAKYIVSRRQFEAALKPSAFERDSFQPEVIEAFKNHNNIQFIDNECFVFSWLELLLFNGHTEGMIVPVVHLGKDSVAFVGDLIPSIAHLDLQSTMDYDVNKLLSLAERQEFLEDAYENGYVLFFQHDAMHQYIGLKNENGKTVTNKMFVNAINLPGYKNLTGLN